MSKQRTVDPDVHDDYRMAYILERVVRYLDLQYQNSLVTIYNRVGPGGTMSHSEQHELDAFRDAYEIVARELQHCRNRIRHFDTELFGVEHE